MSNKLNSKNVENFHPILPEVFASEAIITFDLTKFKQRSPSKVFATNVLSIYKIFHNICYYTCVMPFKIIYDESAGDNSEITFQESKFQKGIFFILHITRIFHALPTPLKSMPGSQIHIDPTQFYHLIQSLTGFMMTMTFTIVCLRQSRLKVFVTKFYEFRQQPSGQKHRSKIIHLLMLIPFSIIVFYTISSQRDQLNFASPIDFVESGAEATVNHFIFWQENHSEELRWQNWTTPEMSYVEMAGKLGITLIYIELTIFEYSVAILLEVLVFMLCFLVCQIGYDFWDAIRVDSNAKNLTKLSQCYQEMKSLMDELNWTFGYQILSFVIAAIPYYGVHTIEIFTGAWFQRIETIYFMLLYSGALLLAAEGHRKFQQFPEFIFNNQKQLEGENYGELSMFITEVTTSQIGLKGFGFFVLSYGFLGNILGLVLTHMIIMLQFQTSQRC